MREPPRRQKRMSGWLVAVAVVTGVAAVLHWGPAGLFDGSRTVVSHPAPFLSVTLAKQNPYAANDPWREWLASETICPGGDDALAPPAAQIQPAVCLLNSPRAPQGLPPLPENGILDSASGLKAKDIVACNDFSHTACGKAADADARGIGLTGGAFGENIFWGRRCSNRRASRSTSGSTLRITVTTCSTQVGRSNESLFFSRRDSEA